MVTVPLVTACPACAKQHLDEGVWETRPHRTHRCVNDAFGPGCGSEWRPCAFPTVGVRSEDVGEDRDMLLVRVVPAAPSLQKMAEEISLAVMGPEIPPPRYEHHLEPEPGAAETLPAPPSSGEAGWRVGRKLGRTIYRDGACVGMLDTPELAAFLAAAANARRAAP